MVSEILNGFGDTIFQGTVYLMNIRFNKLKKKQAKQNPWPHIILKTPQVSD